MSTRASAQSSMIRRRLPERTELFERALDCLPDGVLLVRDGKNIVYANQAFKRIWNVPEGMIESGDDAALLPLVASQVVDTDAFLGEVKRLYGSADSSQDIVLLKDGRVLSRQSVPLAGSGTLQTRIWVFTDVTEASHARIDQLTGLPNRRAYAKEYQQCVLAQDDGLVRSVAILDLDNFKSYNDIYGHAAGDAVLRQIGDVLRGCLTKSDDLMFRIGGEEFLVACRFRTRSAAGQFFEEIRSLIQARAIEHSGNKPYDCVTASFGVAVFTGPQEPEAAFHLADTCLYKVKASGRNRVALDYLV